MALSRTELEIDAPSLPVLPANESGNTNTSDSASTHRDMDTDNAAGTIKTDSSCAAHRTTEDTNQATELPLIFKSPISGISRLPRVPERYEGPDNLETTKKKPQLNSDSYGHMRYQQWQQLDTGDIRHQLLVQRTFSNQDDYLEPRTSSPLRKIRICTAASGIQTVTVSPSSGTFPSSIKSSATSTQEIQEIFKTPNRNQNHYGEASMSHPLTPSLMSPASTSSFRITPGRQFFNPFELDCDRMHMPIYSPNMFRMTGSANSDKKHEKETFWSIEHAALIMPVDIKEAELHMQHRYQQRLDKEKDASVQSAINKFFANEQIAPSPWSDKVQHILPRTPGSIRSVSSQTALSLPPDVDLLALLEGKYLLPDYISEPSPSSDCFGNTFIRRKLLNQLNDTDSALLGSPLLPVRETERALSSPSPVKQTTPEWEKQTPSEAGSGHFSSSPIYQVPDRNGRQRPAFESDLLASPELSPIAGQNGKSVRSSGIFYSHQDIDSPRAVMQLDFSSILDDPEDAGGELNDKTGTLIQRGGSNQRHSNSITRSGSLSVSCDHQFLVSDITHDMDQNSSNSLSGTGQFCRSVLTSAASTESTSDTAVMTLQSGQDTGYQTASLQTTNHESASNSNCLISHGGPSSSNQSTILNSVPKSFSSDLFTDLRPFRDHVQVVNVSENVEKLKHMSNMNLDGSFLGLAFDSCKEKSSSAEDVASLRKSHETFRVRKVRTLSDMRHLKEKSNVSRDLIQSFNEEQNKSDINTSVHSPWLDLNSDSFIPIASRIINQGNSTQNTSSSLSPLCKNFFTAVHKKLDSHYTAYDGVTHENNISMQSASPFFSSSLEKNVLDISRTNEGMGCEESHAKFSLDDDSSLKEARLLLSRSEEFRKTILQSKPLENDSLYQAISSNGEQEDFLEWLPTKDIPHRSQTPLFRTEPIDSSTPTSRKQSCVRNVESQMDISKPGSQIAAEIMKRAGDDLAKITAILGNGKT